MQTILAIFAHPDDAEILCTGTLSLLSKAGWEVHIATLTPGDKGTTEYTREEISRIRTAEAARSAALIGATYHCLDFEDLYILYDRQSVRRVSSLIRKIKPSLVITSSPEDYMMDHEVTALLAQTACFSCGIKNLEIPESIFEPVPYLYYADPMEGKNKYGHLIKPSLFIDISGEIELKKQMLGCHESQRNWLRQHHQMDEYIDSMERFSRARGEEAKTRYAEGFRQHLGHGFPQENLLHRVLKDYAMII